MFLNNFFKIFDLINLKIILTLLLIFNLSPIFGSPIINDNELEIEEFVTGLNYPTSIEFIEEGLFVLQKGGEILFVKNGKVQTEPVLNVEVSRNSEDGLLGIVSSGTDVYVYFTESIKDGGEDRANRIYKYHWDGSMLKNPVLVKEFPVGPKHQHNGGKMIKTFDGKIYAVIGDIYKENLFQNFDTSKIDDTGGIIHVNFDELILKPSQTENPLDHYVAVGIRNSFGLAVDPVTGYLWDTENGPDAYDEINLVTPKFNSGWKKIMGPATELEISSLPKIDNFFYSDPEFSWQGTVAPTGLTFVNSTKLKNLSNSLLVGSFNFGSIYEFKLNDNRTGFVFQDTEFNDLVANPNDPIENLEFGRGFGGITDIKVGPDGLLYVVSLTDGTIYRVIPREESRKDIDFSRPDCTIEPKPKINWSGCDFAGKDIKNSKLTNANLEKINFSGADLQNADLSFANLQNADLSFANLQNADLSFANLQNSNLLKTISNNATFSHSNLTNAILDGGVYINVDFSETNLLDARFNHADFTNSTFKNANFNDTRKWESLSFYQSSLDNADFSGSNIYIHPVEKCFGSNFVYKSLRFVMTEIHYWKIPALKSVEEFIPNLCPPEYRIDITLRY